MVDRDAEKQECGSEKCRMGSHEGVVFHERCPSLYASPYLILSSIQERAMSAE